MTLRRTAPAAPLLLLAYGLLRLFDGLDGVRGPGVAQTLGHLAFVGALLAFVVLVAAVPPLVRRGGGQVAAAALAATIAGAACLLWSVTDVLSPLLRAPLPVPVEIAGPLLFSLGMLTVLGLLVAARRVPAWSPLLFGAGVVTALIDLDFLPFAALILLAALAPLARPDRPLSAVPASRDLLVAGAVPGAHRSLSSVGAAGHDM